MGIYVKKHVKRKVRKMAIKTYKLMKLEELGILFQAKDGKWYVSVGLDGVDITDELFAAGMFEH